MSAWDGRVHGEIGRLRLVGNKIQCHCCGRFYRSLASHVVQTHGFSADEYRAAFGLNKSRALWEPGMSERQRANVLELEARGRRHHLSAEYNLALMSPEARREMSRRASMDLRTENRNRRSETYKKLGRAWRGRKQSSEHVERRVAAIRRRSEDDLRRSEDDLPPETLPLRDAARVLGVHPVTLRRWIADGRVPSALRTPTGYLRVPVAALSTMLQLVGVSRLIAADPQPR
jgi:hypothetical protein